MKIGCIRKGSPKREHAQVERVAVDGIKPEFHKTQKLSPKI